jgi:chemotaxis protein CheY-P-specific phosphatase CheC
VSEAGWKVHRLSAGRLRVATGAGRLMPLEAFTDVMGRPEEETVTVSMTLATSPPLELLLCLTPEARDRVAARVAGGMDPIDPPLADSVLQEVGNIFGTAIANGLARRMAITVRTSTPEVRTDMAGAVIGSVLGQMGAGSDRVALLDVKFLTRAAVSGCSVFLFLDDIPAWHRLLEAAPPAETG